MSSCQMREGAAGVRRVAPTSPPSLHGHIFSRCGSQILPQFIYKLCQAQPTSVLSFGKLSRELFVPREIFQTDYFNAKQNLIYKRICIKIINIGRQFSILTASPSLQYYCRRIARFISVTAIYCWSRLLISLSSPILCLSLMFLLKLENILENF